MTKKQAISVISRAAEIYNRNFIGRKLLVIFGSKSHCDFIEIIGSDSNFLHLTGMD